MTRPTHIASLSLDAVGDGYAVTVIVAGKTVRIAPMRTLTGALTLAANAVLEERATAERRRSLPDYVREETP